MKRETIVRMPDGQHIWDVGFSSREKELMLNDEHFEVPDPFEQQVTHEARKVNLSLKGFAMAGAFMGGIGGLLGLVLAVFVGYLFGMQVPTWLNWLPGATAVIGGLLGASDYRTKQVLL